MHLQPSLEASGKLLASDAGIWTFDDFVNREELLQLLQMARRYNETFSFCANDGEVRPSNAHSDMKRCIKISKEYICDGDHDNLSNCNDAKKPISGRWCPNRTSC